MTLSPTDVAVERAMRSIFVANLPIEAPEESSKELFSEFGPVLSAQFFKDDTCQYAICEFSEQEIALTAIRSLNSYDIQGRALKVDLASSDKSKTEIASLQESAGDVEAGSDGNVEKAPEEISKAVASLPAEQMFELMKQMKMCIENNPQEARNLLLQNPQLAFALLQAQVIMRIVDPEVALKILNRPAPDESLTEDEPKDADLSVEQPVIKMEPDEQEANTGNLNQMRLLQMNQDLRLPMVPPTDKDMRQMTGDIDLRSMVNPGVMPFDPRFRPNDPRMMPGSDPRLGAAAINPRQMQVPDQRDPRSMAAADPRTARTLMDPRSMAASDPRGISGDPRMMPSADPRLLQGVDSRMIAAASDPGIMQNIDPRMIPGSDPRTVSSSRIDPRLGASSDPRTMAGINFAASAVAPRVEDPRKFAGVAGGRAGVLGGLPGMINSPLMAPRQPIPTAAMSNMPEDEEKAALIMQVLQLSNEQIARLPPEQRNSILVLKEQIVRSQL